MLNKRQIGAEYETLACEYLTARGYEILEKNYRNKYGEIDIIAKQKNALIFTEVKFRRTKAAGDALEAVNFAKQKRISKTAFFYYAKNGYEENTPCRFDVIAVYGDNTIRHIENAFEYIPIL